MAKRRPGSSTLFQFAQAGDRDALTAETAVQIGQQHIDVLRIRILLKVALHFPGECAAPSLF
ncbi:hypothetical protein DMB90_13360 [Raoultella planticola]|uniref:Uncharacterized protein n=1 Tax=Raoultella planticola TaxID=575 RepID=A0A5P6AAV6_RAOPL|nr:hypothetical protein DMB90_13360 [Raoultella planticola]